MARPRRSPKKLRVAKSPRTARAAPRTPTRKLAARERQDRSPGAPHLRRHDGPAAGGGQKGLGAGRGGEDPGPRTRAADRVHDRLGHSAFRTCSRRGPRARGRATSSGSPASSRTPAACSPRCTAAGCGPCGSSPASARPEDTNQRFKYLLAHGMTGPLDRLRYARAHGLRRRPPDVAAARSARRAWRSPRSRTSRSSSTASRSTRSRRR